MRQQRWRRGGAVRSWRVRLFQGQDEQKLSIQDEQKLSIASCRCTVILSRAGAGRTGSAAVGATPHAEIANGPVCTDRRPVLSQFGVSEFGSYMCTFTCTCTCNPRTAVGPKIQNEPTLRQIHSVAEAVRRFRRDSSRFATDRMLKVEPQVPRAPATLLK